MVGKVQFPNSSGPIKPIDQGKAASRSSFKESFAKVLESEFKSGLKFSAHAQKRLLARNINLSDEHMSRVKEAVSKAAAKGARESLILLDDLAFVVSVKNRTVITAIEGESIKENVFTNIDSAVIM
ncbi:MAG: TIGR02530 family flagellar biosynthesis protein [Actinomycetota bacterium]|nr:TIGR02530 family flagellar biosynthesis protein [Actinomycetota bacterium]